MKYGDHIICKNMPYHKYKDFYLCGRIVNIYTDQYDRIVIVIVDTKGIEHKSGPFFDQDDFGIINEVRAEHYLLENQDKKTMSSINKYLYELEQKKSKRRHTNQIEFDF